MNLHEPVLKRGGLLRRDCGSIPPWWPRPIMMQSTMACRCSEWIEPRKPHLTRSNSRGPSIDYLAQGQRLRHSAAPLLQTCRAAWHSQQSVDRRGAHGKDLLAHRLTKMQMPIALHSRQQNWQQRPQALPADPIRGLPEHDQRSPYRLVVQRGSDKGLSPLRDRLGVQRSNRRLVVIAAQSPVTSNLRQLARLVTFLLTQCGGKRWI